MKGRAELTYRLTAERWSGGMLTHSQQVDMVERPTRNDVEWFVNKFIKYNENPITDVYADFKVKVEEYWDIQTDEQLNQPAE